MTQPRQTVVTYDGLPDAPAPGGFWSFVAHCMAALVCASLITGESPRVIVVTAWGWIVR